MDNNNNDDGCFGVPGPCEQDTDIVFST